MLRLGNSLHLLREEAPKSYYKGHRHIRGSKTATIFAIDQPHPGNYVVNIFTYTISCEIECLMNYGMRFVTLYRRQGSRPSSWKRKAKNKMVVWGGLTNSCEMKRSEKQRSKGKI